MRALFNLFLITLSSSIVIECSIANEVAPILEESTIAVLRLPTDRMEEDTTQFLINRLASVAPLENVSKFFVPIVALKEKLKSQNVRDVYITLSTNDWVAPKIILGGIALYIPCQNPEDIRELTEKEFANGFRDIDIQSRVVANGVVVASKSVIERLEKQPAHPRPRLIADTTHGGIALSIEIPQYLKDELRFLLQKEARPSKTVTERIEAVLPNIESLELNVASDRSIIAIRCSRDDNAGQLKQLLLDSQTTGLGKGLEYQVVQSNSEVQVSLAAPALHKMMKELQNRQQMKELVRAVLEFEARHRVLPPRELRSQDGKPLLSWRVFILPFLNQPALYNQFHFDEPWDSPHNRTLISKMPDIFAMIDGNGQSEGKTSILLPMIRDGLWYGESGMLRSSIAKDGDSNTIAVMSASSDRSVIWTKPEELMLDENNLTTSFFGNEQGVWIGMLDASSLRLDRSTSPTKIRAYLTPVGGEKIEE